MDRVTLPLIAIVDFVAIGGCAGLAITVFAYSHLDGSGRVSKRIAPFFLAFMLILVVVNVLAIRAR